MAIEKYNTLIRLFVPEPELYAELNIELSDGQAHYLRNVMRKDIGESLRLFNGRDGEWLGTLSEINKKKAVVTLVQQTHEQKPCPDVHVFASPVKKEAFDLMVEKSCELGARSFTPVICDRTVVHRVNAERLQAIATEAAEQSERLDVMEIRPLISLKNCLSSMDKNINLIFCIERKDVPPLAETVEKLKGKPLGILIGAEGGFSEAEIAAITHYSFVHPVTLGERILKAETALLATLANITL
jgi:16S rRNA (uracil1498-N3)-methyltransferase